MEECFLLQAHAEHFMRGPRRVAFDIGANKGEWTHWLSQHFDHVLAAEPDRRAAAGIRRHIPKNATLCEYAVADSAGPRDFYLRDKADQSSVLPEHPIGGGNQAETSVVAVERVHSVTLDGLLEISRHSFFVDEVDFIKIDVEGAEHLVMNGATPGRFRNTRWLIEVHDNQRDVGYAVRRLGHENFRIMPHPYASAHPNHFWILVNEA